MKQPIHYVHIKHRTCATKTGRRRSPVLGPSYEIGIPLKDDTTGRTVFKPHTDGTEIIYAEIFSNEAGSPYADKSIPLADRAGRLWNDLYNINHNNQERVAFYGEIALPNCLTDKEKITVTERIGQHLATTLNRQIQVGLHKKKGNDHIHISGSEREYKNGKFQQKRKKFYKDLNGNLIYDKIYKDANGWDIRKPVIDLSKVPTGKDPYTRDKTTGDYLYQKLGERNKKQWENDTRTGKFLNKNDLSKLHDDIDKIVNNALLEFGYQITVKRHPKNNNQKDLKQIRIQKDLKQIRIPIKDYKTNSPFAEEIKERNKKIRTIQRLLKINKIKIRKQKSIVSINQEILDAKIKLQKTAETELIKTEKELEQAEKEYQLAMSKQTYLDFVKIYTATQNHEISYDENIYKEISARRNTEQEKVIQQLIAKLPTSSQNNLLKASKTKDITDYLKKHPKVLKELTGKYGFTKEFQIYEKWSILGKGYYNFNPKNLQKDSQHARDGLQIDGR